MQNLDVNLPSTLHFTMLIKLARHLPKKSYSHVPILLELIDKPQSKLLQYSKFCGHQNVCVCVRAQCSILECDSVVLCIV